MACVKCAESRLSNVISSPSFHEMKGCGAGFHLSRHWNRDLYVLSCVVGVDLDVVFCQIASDDFSAHGSGS